ncbi:hypothetical protein CBS147308_8723 [Penicillium roqueforti]|nr:hypothetical protein CBS147308_8723 [Penicillium roqueforti]
MLRNTKKMKMLRRSLLLRILLEYSNTSPQHHGEVAAHRWGVMTSPWRAKSCMTEHIFTYTGLIGCEGAQVLHRWARGSDSRGHGSSEVLGFAAPPLRDTVDNAEPILRDTVDNAEPILRDTVVIAEPILRDTVVIAEPILRGLLLTQDLGCGELGYTVVSCRELVNAAVSYEDCC